MMCSRVSIGIAIAPVAWRRTILLIPFFIGRYWDLSDCDSLAGSLKLATSFGDRKTEFNAQACNRQRLADGMKPLFQLKKVG